MGNISPTLLNQIQEMTVNEQLELIMTEKILIIRVN